jgi:hypothetical protein
MTVTGSSGPEKAKAATLRAVRRDLDSLAHLRLGYPFTAEEEVRYDLLGDQERGLLGLV